MKVKNISNIAILKSFVLLVILLIIISLFFKGIILYSSRSFVNNSFNLLVESKNKDYLLHTDKQFNSVKIYSISNKKRARTLVEKSILFGIPLDGVIKTEKEVNSIYPDFFSSISIAKIFVGKEDLMGLNKFDLLSIYSFIKNLRSSEITEKNFNSIRDIAYDDFKNSTIMNEGKDVEIDNATDFDGLATRVGDTLKNEGFNVILTRSTKESKESRILINEPSKTSERLEKLFGLKAQKVSVRSIADIVVVIGSDLGEKISKINID